MVLDKDAFQESRADDDQVFFHISFQLDYQVWCLILDFYSKIRIGNKKLSENKFVRTKMRPKGGTNMFKNGSMVQGQMCLKMVQWFNGSMVKGRVMFHFDWYSYSMIFMLFLPEFCG